MTDDKTDSQKAGGRLLGKLMARRALSPPRLSQLTGGEVSATTIRSYLAGASAPQISKARAVAKVIGGRDGADLLTAWGLEELAEGHLEDEAREREEQERREREFVTPPLGTRIEAAAPAPEEPSDVGRTLRLRVLIEGETFAGGRLLLAVDEDGNLYAAIPLKAVKGLAG